MPLRIEAEDELELCSVGVDIGSATTHLTISRLLHKKVGTRYVVVDRRVLHESPVLLTPYLDDTAIDAGALEGFVEEQHARAGIPRDAVDTGALILTGVALRRRNARAVAEVFAHQAGRFVAVSAGDHLEAVMAAHGSGAVAHSRRSGRLVLAVDIGGGTTKLALCRDGRVVATTALDVGARLVVVDADQRVVRAEEPIAGPAAELGLDLRPGVRLPRRQQRLLAEHLVTRLLRHLPPASPPAADALLRAPALDAAAADVIALSGGVAEYVSERQQDAFGDLGPALAAVLRQRLPRLGPQLLDSGGIRATVLGASQHTVQVSGSTIHVSDPSLLPLPSVPVVVPDAGEVMGTGTVDEAAVSAAVARALARRELSATEPVAVAVRWTGPVTRPRLLALARGLVAGAGGPRVLVVLCDADVGRLLGRRVAEIAPAQAVVSIDGVAVGQLDHVDVGGLLPGSAALSVVVKSLVFAAVPGVLPEPSRS